MSIVGHLLIYCNNGSLVGICYVWQLCNIGLYIAVVVKSFIKVSPGIGCHIMGHWLIYIDIYKYIYINAGG